MAHAVSDHALDSTEAALERARAKGDHDRIVRLELKRDRLQAKAFRALQKKIAGMPR